MFVGIGRLGPSRDIVGDGFGVVVDDGRPLDRDRVDCCVSTGVLMRLQSSSGRSNGSILVSLVVVGLMELVRDRLCEDVGVG